MPPYLWLLGVAMRNRWTTVVMGILFFAGSMALAAKLPSDFLVAADRGRSIASVELPPGATLADTDAVILAMTTILRAHPEVTGVYATEGTETQAGLGSINSSGEVRSAIVTANLRPRSDRVLSEQRLEDLFSAELAPIPGARIQFGGDGQSGAKVAVTLVGDDLGILRAATDALQAEMRELPGFVSPNSTASLAKPEIVIAPDAARTAELGVSTAMIAQAIDVATIGDNDQSLPKFNLGDRQLSIVVSLDEKARDRVSMLANLPVSGASSTVPLGAIAQVRFGAGPNQITRLDRRHSIAVEAGLQGMTLGQAGALVATLNTMRNLPTGVTEAKTGDSEHLQELQRGFVTAVGTGIVLMYLTLALLFGGFLQPLTILVALPLSLGGALGLLLICGFALSVTALIGLLMLMGIAAKNSILLVDYAIIAMRERGLGASDAVYDAAAKRARPIVMTSLAMGAGMLPVALGLGADAESRAPMAVAVIGGLISSTVLSLVYVPVVFSLMHGLQVRGSRLLARFLAEPATRQVDDKAVSA